MDRVEPGLVRLLRMQDFFQCEAFPRSAQLGMGQQNVGGMDTTEGVEDAGVAEVDFRSLELSRGSGFEEWSSHTKSCSRIARFQVYFGTKVTTKGIEPLLAANPDSAQSGKKQARADFSRETKVHLPELHLHSFRGLLGFHGIQQRKPHGGGMLTDRDVARFRCGGFHFKQAQRDLPTLRTGESG